MISAKRIKSMFDKVVPQYEACWSTLIEIKAPKDTQSYLNRFFEFQPTLCQAFLRLETTYRAICQEESNLITRKAHVNQLWFV
jgi:hypothetical protein